MICLYYNNSIIHWKRLAMHKPAVIAVILMTLVGGCPTTTRPTGTEQPENNRAVSTRQTTGPAGPTTRPEPTGERNTRSGKGLQTRPAPSTRCGRSIEPAVLNVNGETLTARAVLTRTGPALANLAKRYDRRAFAERAKALMYMAVQDLISEILLEQKVSARITDQQAPMLEKVVDKALEDRVVRGAGGSRVRLEAILAKQNATIEDLRRDLRRRILTSQYLREKITPMIIITRDDLWEYYQSHRSEFDRPGRADLHVIELDAAKSLPTGVSWPSATEQQRRAAQALIEKRAEQVCKRLADGEDFNKLAAEISTGPSGKLGGEIGWITPGSYRIKQIDALAFSMPVNTVSDPITIGTKTYIIKINARQPPQTITFTEAQATIRPVLEERRYTELRTRELAQLRAKSHIRTQQVLAFVRNVIRRMPGYEKLKSTARSAN